MATEIAKAYVQIIPSTGGIKNELTSQMGGDVEAAGDRAGKSFGKSMLGALGKLGIAAAVGKTVKDAISVGSELEQNLGGTEAVFGAYAKRLQGSAQAAYKNMGLAATDYMATANKMGSLFQGSGVEQQRSLELTTKAMQRAADVASVMGIDMDMAMESVAGAAKGNFTMMDNLGVAMNATTIEAYAMSKGMDDFKYSTATNAEKAELAMEMFFEKTQQYEGNFLKESNDTLSGSLGRMQASLKNVLGNIAIGQDVAPALNQLGDSVVTFLDNNLFPMITNVVKALPETITNLITTLTPKLVPAGMSMISGLIEGFSRSMPNFLQAIAGLIPELVTQITAGLPELLDASISLFMSIVEAIPVIIPQLISALPQIIGNILTYLADSAPKIFDAAFNALLNIAKAIPKVLVSVFTAMIDLGQQLVKGLWQGIKNMTNWVLDKIKGFGQSILNGVKNVFDVHSPSKETEWIGEMLDRGLANGISGNADLVHRAMGDVADSTLSTFSPTISKINTSSARYNTARTETQSAVDVSGTSASDKPIILQVTLDGKVVGETAWNYNRQRARAMG